MPFDVESESCKYFDVAARISGDMLQDILNSDLYSWDTRGEQDSISQIRSSLIDFPNSSKQTANGMSAVHSSHHPSKNLMCASADRSGIDLFDSAVSPISNDGETPQVPLMPQSSKYTFDFGNLPTVQEPGFSCTAAKPLCQDEPVQQNFFIDLNQPSKSGNVLHAETKEIDCKSINYREVDTDYTNKNKDLGEDLATAEVPKPSINAQAATISAIQQAILKDPCAVASILGSILSEKCPDSDAGFLDGNSRNASAKERPQPPLTSSQTEEKEEPISAVDLLMQDDLLLPPQDVILGNGVSMDIDGSLDSALISNPNHPNQEHKYVNSPVSLMDVFRINSGPPEMKPGQSLDARDCLTTENLNSVLNRQESSSLPIFQIPGFDGPSETTQAAGFQGTKTTGRGSTFMDLPSTRHVSDGSEFRRVHSDQAFDNRPAGSTSVQPSRFCHICLRRAGRVALLACSNAKEGTCRKVICEKCFNCFGWSWDEASNPESNWTCTHCRDA